MKPANVLVLSNPAAPHLKALSRLPDSATITVTDNLERALEVAPHAGILFNALFTPDLLKQVFPAAVNVRWVHHISAGVDHVLFPELRASSVPLTNGRGVFKRSLAEFAIAAAMFFAKNIRGMLRLQAEGRWEQFEVEEISGRTLGIVGYGEIGCTVAELAKPFGMRIIAIRRRPTLSTNDSLLDAVYSPERILDLMGESDYLVAAAPNTPETRGMIGEREIAAMKRTAVIVNIGRGPVIDEPSLIRALEEKRIRGAALDVFNQEPLPEGHPFYRLDNVLMSFHCADHVENWIDSAVDVFVRNFFHFEKGEPLENVVDKNAGY
jgi:phosphoglycerate dehydrogenase-like enzyme